jgi:hypothetical protein
LGAPADRAGWTARPHAAPCQLGGSGHNTDALGLEKAGSEPDSHDYIKTDARLETSVPGVWVLGDVNGGPAFTHISFNDYQIVLGNLSGTKISASRIGSFHMRSLPIRNWDASG